MKFLRFHTTKDFSLDKNNTMTCLDAYVSRMKEGQKQLYYFGGENVKDIYRSPLVQGIVRKGYEVLMMEDPLDEYIVHHVM